MELVATPCPDVAFAPGFEEYACTPLGPLSGSPGRSGIVIDRSDPSRALIRSYGSGEQQLLSVAPARNAERNIIGMSAADTMLVADLNASLQTSPSGPMG